MIFMSLSVFFSKKILYYGVSPGVTMCSRAVVVLWTSFGVMSITFHLNQLWRLFSNCLRPQFFEGHECIQGHICETEIIQGTITPSYVGNLSKGDIYLQISKEEESCYQPRRYSHFVSKRHHQLSVLVYGNS